MAKEHADRAKQFMPFAALKGYYELICERERVVEPRRERTEEDALRLSQELARVERGSLVKVTYYHVDAYETIEGMVARIDTTFRTLAVIKTTIPFDDIFEVELCLP